MITRKNILKLFVKLAISALILGILVSRMDLGTLGDMTHHFKAGAWLWAVLFVLAQFILITYRWMVLINIGRTRMNYKESLQVTLASLVANTLFITAITGVAVRVAMSLQYGASLLKALLATVTDRLMTLAALLFLSAVFLPRLGDYMHEDLYRNLCLYIGAFIFLTFFFAPLFFKILLKILPRLPLHIRHIRSGTRYLSVLLGDMKIFGKVTFSSLAGQLCFFASVYCITLSANTDIAFLDLMTVLPIITLVASLPISFGGWGVREGAFIYGLGLLGIPMETAFLISVQTGLIGLLVTVGIGVPVITLMDIKFSAFPKNMSLKNALQKKS